jgi:hypothetical protein
MNFINEKITFIIDQLFFFSFYYDIGPNVNLLSNLFFHPEPIFVI